MTKKRMLSVRVSELTAQQMQALSAACGTNQAETLTVAIDRMYWQQFGVAGEFHQTPAEFYVEAPDERAPLRD